MNFLDLYKVIKKPLEHPKVINQLINWNKLLTVKISSQLPSLTCFNNSATFSNFSSLTSNLALTTFSPSTSTKLYTPYSSGVKTTPFAVISIKSYNKAGVL